MSLLPHNARVSRNLISTSIPHFETSILLLEIQLYSDSPICRQEQQLARLDLEHIYLMVKTGLLKRCPFVLTAPTTKSGRFA
jgi:hypothetical protein